MRPFTATKVINYLIMRSLYKNLILPVFLVWMQADSIIQNSVTDASARCIGALLSGCRGGWIEILLLCTSTRWCSRHMFGPVFTAYVDRPFIQHTLENATLTSHCCHRNHHSEEHNYHPNRNPFVVSDAKKNVPRIPQLHV